MLAVSVVPADRLSAELVAALRGMEGPANRHVRRLLASMAAEALGRPPPAMLFAVLRDHDGKCVAGAAFSSEHSSAFVELIVTGAPRRGHGSALLDAIERSVDVGVVRAIPTESSRAFWRARGYWPESGGRTIVAKTRAVPAE